MGKLLSTIIMLMLLVAPAAAFEPHSDLQAHEPETSLLLEDSDLAEAFCLKINNELPEELSIAQGGCCRICRTGKACGNSCINRNYTCRQPRGCACDG